MHQGEIYKKGSPVEVITEQSLREVYEVQALIAQTEFGLSVTVVEAI